MTVVGGVTGNKSLMKIGGVLGLVGGVGGLINSATSGAAASAGGFEAGFEGTSALTDAAAAGAGDAAGMGASGFEGGLDAATSFGDDIMSSGFESGNFTSMVDDAVASLGDVTGSAMQPPSLNVMGGPPAGAAPEANFAAASDLTPPSATATPGTSPSDPFIGNNPSALSADGSKISYQPDTNVYSPNLGKLPTSDAKSYFSGFLNWVKQNKELSNNILKLGGEAMKGMSDRDMFDEKMAVERSRTQYGNQVARYGRPLIGAR